MLSVTALEIFERIGIFQQLLKCRLNFPSEFLQGTLALETN